MADSTTVSMELPIPCMIEALETRLFEIANQIAVEQASKLQWSSYHVWEYFQRSKSIDDLPNEADRIWDEMSPFGHCLGMATLVTKAFQKAILDTPGLTRYADHVQMAVAKWKQDVTSDRYFHCLTLIHLETHCTIIDLCAQPEPFKVFLGKQYKAEKLANFMEEEYSGFEFEYRVEDGKRWLNFPEWKAVPFLPMDPTNAVRELAFPASKRVKPTFSGLLPSRKTIIARTLFNYEPAGLSSTKHGAKYLAESCKVRIDFAGCQIGIQMPYIDWLYRLENQKLLARLEEVKGLERFEGPLKDVVGYYFVGLRRYEKQGGVESSKEVQLMDEICSHLGLPHGEVVRIAKVLLQTRLNASQPRPIQAGGCSFPPPSAAPSADASFDRMLANMTALLQFV